MQRARHLKGASAATKLVATGGPAPSCAVVGEAELQRIRDIVDQKAARTAEAEVARREELRLTSEARVKHWPNTIEAQRQRKEQARRERLEREEARRQAIDEEERALREAQKARAIEKANVQLYEENDKVRTFTSKLFLATVLEEREKQLAVKDERKRQQQALEMEWALRDAAVLREAEEAELAKASAARGKTHALKDAQLQQLADIRVSKIRERDAGVAEGQAIKRAAEDAVREEEEAEAARLAAQRQAAKDLIVINEESRRLRDAAKKREAEEEAKIALFAAQKEQQMLERKTRADEKFAAKLRRRQELIDAQAAQLAELKAQAEERELRAMRDFDRERTERERREKEARDRRQRDIELFRAKQRDMQAAARAREAEERARMTAIWRDRAELLIDEELAERREARQKAEELQHFHVLQAQEKRQQALLEKRGDIEEGLSMQEALKEEHAMYNDYVNSVMAEYVAKGRGSDLVRMAASRAKARREVEM